MAKNSFLWIGSTAALSIAAFIGCAAALTLPGCAKGQVDFEDDGVGGDTVTPPLGGMNSGGGSAAGGGLPSNCPMDCSAIATQDCMEAVCNETTKQCEVVAADAITACDDGIFCTVNDSCDGLGVCVGGSQNTCGIQNTDCEEVTCDEASSSCALAPLAPGADCTPSDLCQVGGTCQNGLCLGTQIDCFFAPVPNECFTSTCNPANGMCEPEPGNFGELCTDVNDLCTIDKACDNTGVCIGGTPKDCSFLSVGCNDGVCDTMSGQCISNPIPNGMQCASATDDCNQGICTNGSCLPNAINEAGACEDGLICTSGTTCVTGVCQGGMSTNTIFMSENFSNNIAGWTLDNEWAIGPAQSSTPGFCGSDPGDPPTDFSSTQDNGLAGVVIGGNAAQTTHPYQYLTSTPVNTAGASSLYLEYYRSLQSDYPSFMTNIVEVYDGSTWQTVWVQPSGPPINDLTWMPFSWDVTQWANANMQVRFGFEIGSAGVYSCSQWSVDNVVLTDQPCQ
jgi:hypothetical protein